MPTLFCAATSWRSSRTATNANDPRSAIKCQMSKAERAAVFRGNAQALYGLT